jgi:hypothetical protein
MKVIAIQFEMKRMRNMIKSSYPLCAAGGERVVERSDDRVSQHACRVVSVMSG